MFYREFYDANRVWLDRADKEIRAGSNFTDWIFYSGNEERFIAVSHSIIRVVIDFESQGDYGRIMSCKYGEDPTNPSLLGLQCFEDWTKPTEQEKDYFEMIYGVRIPWGVDTPFVMV